MAKRRVLEVKLEKAHLDATGLAGSRKEQRMVRASLIWPRAAISERLAYKTLEITDGAVDMTSKDWTSRILFKEPVEGRIGISVGISVPVTDAQVKKFYGYVGSSLLKLVGSESSSAISSSIVGGLLKAPLYGLASMVTSLSKESPAIVAEGVVDLQSNSLKATGKARKITVPLLASRTVYRTVRKTRAGKKTTSRRVLIKKASQTAKLSLL